MRFLWNTIYYFIWFILKKLTKKLKTWRKSCNNNTSTLNYPINLAKCIVKTWLYLENIYIKNTSILRVDNWIHSFSFSIIIKYPIHVYFNKSSERHRLKIKNGISFSIFFCVYFFLLWRGLKCNNLFGIPPVNMLFIYIFLSGYLYF